MKKKLMLFVAVVCVALGVNAQVAVDSTVAEVLDSVAIKKEATENYEKGNKYWKAKEWDKALTYYNMAAEGGNAEAQYLLGLLCIEGKRMVQDYQKAVEWLEKAGLQGHKDAQFNLASIFYQGKIVPKDTEMAEFWARKYKGLK